MAETMAMLLREAALLPEKERLAIRLAHNSAYDALLALNSIVDDAGNQSLPENKGE